MCVYILIHQKLNRIEMKNRKVFQQQSDRQMQIYTLKTRRKRLYRADLHIRRKKQKKHQVISEVMFISTCNRCGGYSFFLLFF